MIGPGRGHDVPSVQSGRRDRMTREVEMGGDGIAVGKTFRHAKFIGVDGNPELCRVTKVDRRLDVVFYRVGIESGAAGGKFKCPVAYFLDTVLLGWAATGQARYVVCLRETEPGGYEYAVIDAFGAKGQRLDAAMDGWTDSYEAAKAAAQVAEINPALLCASFTIHTREGVCGPDGEPTLTTICGCGRGYAWGHYLDSERLTRWRANHDADVSCPHRPKMQLARDGGTYCADCGVTR